jgi:hypothetical protein
VDRFAPDLPFNQGKFSDNCAIIAAGPLQIVRVEIAAGGALCFFLVQSMRHLLTAPKRKKARFVRVHRRSQRNSK